MKLKSIWQALFPPAKPKLVLHGYTDAQMRRAFLTSPDSEWHTGVLEQCDLSLMEAVNEMLNQSETLTDAQLRERVGLLRGISELRERFEAREAQARLDQENMARPEEGKEGE